MTDLEHACNNAKTPQKPTLNQRNKTAQKESH